MPKVLRTTNSLGKIRRVPWLTIKSKYNEEIIHELVILKINGLLTLYLILECCYLQPYAALILENDNYHVFFSMISQS